MVVQPQPVRHDWQSNSPIVIAAQDTASQNFQIEGSAEVGYQFAVDDDSSLNIGFIRHEDLAEYKDGQQVSAWAFQQNTAGTTQTTTLSAGDYDFVMTCRNSFGDCDLHYSLWATY